MLEEEVHKTIGNGYSWCISENVMCCVPPSLIVGIDFSPDASGNAGRVPSPLLFLDVWDSSASAATFSGLEAEPDPE